MFRKIAIISLLVLACTVSAARKEYQQRMRTVSVRDIVDHATTLVIRLRGSELAQEIVKIIRELNSLSLADVIMLNNPFREEDNELVDLANKINNLIDMISEDITDPSGVGALIMAGNDLKVYLQKNRKIQNISNEKSSS